MANAGFSSAKDLTHYTNTMKCMEEQQQLSMN